MVSLKPSVSVKVESEKKNQWEICIMILIAKNWLMLLWGQARQVQNLQGTLSGMAGRGAQDGVYTEIISSPPLPPVSSSPPPILLFIALLLLLTFHSEKPQL